MVSERELVDLRAQVTRLQADSTAELLKHRERKELLEKAQQQCFKLLKKYSNCLNDLQSEREEHRVQLAARDARVAELTMAIRSFLYDGNIREGAITANGCTCKYALESVEALDAALAGKATVKESVTVVRTNMAALRYTPDTRRKAIESITAELLAYCQRRAEAKERRGQQESR